MDFKQSWKKLKLGEIGEVIGGGTPSTKNNKYYNGNIPWITPRDLSGYQEKYISSGNRYISQEGLQNSSAKLLPKGTVLFSSRAPIGYIAIAENELATNQGFKSIIPKKEYITTDYLFYLLKYNTNDIKKLGSGTTFPEVSGKVIKEYEVTIPDLFTQNKISDILSALDDKIEINNKIISNLEEQVQALFKSWFIDFEPFQNEEFVESEIGLIPTRWLVKPLKSVSKITMGQSPKSEYYNLTSNGLPFLQGNTTFGFKFPDVEKYTSKITRESYYKDILISVRAPVGAMNINIFNKICIGRGLASISPDENLSSYIYYYIKAFKLNLLSKSSGTIFQSINKVDLETFKVLVPIGTEYINKFNTLGNSIIDYQIKLHNENIILEKIRNTLLPKLMSGEISVE
ncbi:restriction endonuclease subunit S [Fundicoccus culcitae]|uniref:Restriction endonuclease subunit S n=1 Tax=Fundicoccus culcitae TaxID=2969821 RepID=A0ABY5P3P6_9LACT|nr:restriction endonuclease subunit S [Fundicoccus culcitae]UUX33352.1 restriction endonuclease subunit S [Fundicoccus culcitae]